MNDIIDRPKDIRKGEQLDTAKIETFLKDSIPDLHGDLLLKQFHGGASNLTYYIKIGDREMVLRRPPFGTKAKTAHDMGREFRILTKLRPYYPYCPEPLLYTEDETVMGCPFYVMDLIKGIILQKDIPPAMNFTPQHVREMFDNLVRVHHELHDLDYSAAGLADFGKPQGYVERQVSGWSKRYRNARTPDVPDCEKVMAWLAEKMPPDSDKPGIIHNDFRPNNCVLNPDNPLEVIGVLDWEMATLGDPMMDLGGSLAYYVQADDPEEMQFIRQMPSTAPGAPTRRELVTTYEKLSDRSMDNYDFYYTFGLFRLGVIAQQIYFRYYHGQTRDERFKVLGFVVTVLDRQANRVIEASDL